MTTLDSTKKKSISIAGAGWLGYQILNHISSSNFEIKASTTQADKLLTISETDAEAYLIKLPEAVSNSFLSSDILVITIPPPKAQDAQLFHVEQLKCFSSFRGKVIYTSSTGVYGNPAQLMEVSEGTELSPETESAKTVVAAEKYLQSLFGERLTILRLGGLIGHDRKPGRFLAGRSGLLESLAPVNLVTGEDVVQAIFKTIESDNFGHVLNIVADEHPTRKEYYTKQVVKMGLSLPQFVDAEVQISGKIVSNELSKKVLGLSYGTIDI